MTLTVFAAASLTGPFKPLAHTFEQRHPGVSVELNFAGSQTLAQQIIRGAPADVFASANQRQMESTVEAGAVEKGSPSVFVRNRLVVIYPKSDVNRTESLRDLAAPGKRLVLAAQGVPVGDYSLVFLTRASRDPAFGSDFKQRVLSNVVSYDENVKAVLRKVELGEADGGIVYSSDAATASQDKIGTIDIPDDLNPIASYPIAPVSDTQHRKLAEEFIGLVRSSEGQSVLKRYGFIS